jgi:hypothetical protein
MKRKSLLTLIATTMFSAMFSALGLSQTTPANVSIADRLSGEKTPDFTVTYTVTKKSKLADLSQKDIDVAIDAWVARIKNNLSAGMKSPDNQFIEDNRKTLLMMVAIAQGDIKKHPTMTISKRGNAFLVKWVPHKDEKQIFMGDSKGTIFLYDGKKTFLHHVGADTKIMEGFNYTHTRGFVFPGCGLPGLPMASNLEGDGPEKTCLFFANDGIADVIRDAKDVPDPNDKSVIPQKWPGKLTIASENGRERVVKAAGGNAGQYTQEITYGSDKIKGNVAFPESIHIVSSFNPNWILPFGPYDESKYTLTDISDQSLPEKEFNIEKVIPKKTFIIDNATGKMAVVGIEKGKSLKDQMGDISGKRPVAEENKPNIAVTSALSLGIIGGLVFLIKRKIRRNSED